MIKKIPVLIGLCLVLLFFWNGIIRVIDDSGEDIGIFEKLFFGRSVLSPPWSDDYRRWDSSSQGSREVADIISQYGKALVEDDELEKVRLEAAEISNVAYLAAVNIDLGYLEKSNTELPKMFSTK